MSAANMAPDVYATLAADSSCAMLLSDTDGRLRVFPFGEAPQQWARPLAVWQIVGGAPDNTLDCVPDTDEFQIQFDVYGPTSDACRSAAAAIRDAIEAASQLVISYNGTSRDPATRAYRYSFDVDWRIYRA